MIHDANLTLSFLPLGNSLSLVIAQTSSTYFILRSSFLPISKQVHYSPTIPFHAHSLCSLPCTSAIRQITQVKKRSPDPVFVTGWPDLAPNWPFSTIIRDGDQWQSDQIWCYFSLSRLYLVTDRTTRRKKEEKEGRLWTTAKNGSVWHIKVPLQEAHMLLECPYVPS